MSNIHFVPVRTPSAVHLTPYYVMCGDRQTDTVWAIEDSGRYYIDYGRMNLWLLAEPGTDSLTLMKGNEMIKVVLLDESSLRDIRKQHDTLPTRVLSKCRYIYEVNGGNTYPYILIKWFSLSVYGSGVLVYYPENDPAQFIVIENATFRDFQKMVLSLYGINFYGYINHTSTEIYHDSRLYLFGGKVGVI